MSERLDSFGVKVEVGDIVLSCPKHKWSGKPEVGRVSGVFDSGRVSIQIPSKVTIYAYQRGAPDVETQGQGFGVLVDEDGKEVMEEWTDYYGTKRTRPKYGMTPYTYMRHDYTVVGEEWKWVRKQAADITLIVLRKHGEEKKGLEDILAERVGFNELTRNLNLDYDKEIPEWDGQSSQSPS